MIKTYDGTSFKRLGGKPGDKSPAVGVKRPRTLYTAVGGETSINLSSTSPAISYLPGNAQISVKRSSGGGALISGFDFFELTSSSIGFPSTDPLIAGEVVEIIQDVVITAVMATAVRPDAYTATGVLGQTLITADFSWAYNLNPSKGVGAVQVNLHGTALTRGVDYTEVNLSVTNTNQITLVDPLVGGENIQILPLYEALDTSAAATSFNGTQIASIQAGLSAGTQAFVDTSSLISVPNTAIVGRAKIVDITNDLRASFGIERIAVQQIVQLQNEFGPNGEPVFSAVNDDRGLIRAVGSWTNPTDSFAGSRLNSSSSGTDFIEITFFGTGINIIGVIDNGIRVFTYSVDGGSASTPSASGLNASGILDSRNYSPNQVIPIVSGLSMGIHTVRLNATGTTSNTQFLASGFEILNTNSTTSLNVNPGSAYIAGQKYQALTAQSVPYAASVTGTRGGRVVQYLKADGTIGQTFQAVNAASAFLTSADHTNEEVVRSYYAREFGAGRSDDLSSTNTTGTNRVFTLDDGTTTLFGQDVIMNTLAGQPDGVRFGASSTDFITFTFVGTGVDIFRIDDSGIGTDTYTVTVDGASVGNLNANGSLQLRNEKLCSGLPYGTHTVKITRTTFNYFRITLVKFIVYQPKKPSIPTGAVELADFNIAANYVANTTVGVSNISTGILRKMIAFREGTYSGSWSINAINSNYISGSENFSSAAAGNYCEYTFFGTGFEIRGLSATSYSSNITVTIDGNANWSTYTSGAYGYSIVSSTIGQISFNTASTQAGNGFYLSGLPLGIHKVRLTTNTAAILSMDAFDIITPIYSAKSNTNYDQQNTLPVGSNSLSDNRKTSPIKDTALQKKNISQAFGVSSSPTTSSSVPVPMPDMSVVHTNTTGKIKISWVTEVYGGATDNNIALVTYLDGAVVKTANAHISESGGAVRPSEALVISVSPGTHKIDVFWGLTVGSLATTFSTNRSLLVEEV